MIVAAMPPVYGTVVLSVYNLRQGHDVQYEEEWIFRGEVAVSRDAIAKWVWELGWAAEGVSTPSIGDVTADSVCKWLRNAHDNPSWAASKYELSETTSGTVFLGDNAVDDWLEAIESERVDLELD